MSDMAEKRAHKRWTEKEIEFLKNNIGNKSFSNIAKKLGRTEYSCIKKAITLNLGMYTKNADKITIGEAAEILGVNYSTVVFHIKKGNLKVYNKRVYKENHSFLDLEEVEKFAKSYVKQNNRPWTSFEDSKLKMYLGAGLTYAEIAEKMGRTKSAVQHRGKVVYFK